MWNNCRYFQRINPIIVIKTNIENLIYRYIGGAPEVIRIPKFNGLRAKALPCTPSCTLLRVSTSHPLSLKHSNEEEDRSREQISHPNFMNEHSSRDDFQLMYPKTSYQRKEHSQNNPPFEEKNRVQLILPWWTLFSSLNTVSPFVFPRPFVTFGPKHSSAPSFHRISALFPPVILPRHPIYTCRIHTQRFENL